MRSRSEKIVKSRADWRKHNQVKKLRIVMTVIAIVLCISIASGAILAWLQMKNAVGRAHSDAAKSTASVSDGEGELPVYDNSFSLILVNASNPMSSGYQVTLEDCGGVPVEEKILPALNKMMEDAQSAGCPLKLTGGYVSAKKQEELYQQEVARLMKDKKLSQVLAENQAQSNVGRGGYNENQTGLAVDFSAEGLKSGQNFSTTAQYRWLVQNSINYGFILRYPEDKKSVTGCDFNSSHFRYVGTDNAVKMREVSMCLEEYVSYLGERSD